MPPARSRRRYSRRSVALRIPPHSVRENRDIHVYLLRTLSIMNTLFPTSRPSAAWHQRRLLLAQLCDLPIRTHLTVENTIHIRTLEQSYNNFLPFGSDHDAVEHAFARHRARNML